MLQDFPCAAQVPVEDLDRAKRWYSDMLGLEPFFEESGAIHYLCGGQTLFTLYTSATAGSSEQTVLGWLTPDIEREVANLKQRGVVFESYDFPGLKTDANGIAQIGADRAAWFKDSEGNVLVVGQSGTGLLDRWQGEPV
jgi:catechol 2,3-dioxygenase-like lactoylglutathione lyase family enzyme